MGMREIGSLVDSVKLSIMQGLDARVRGQFRTQEEAAAVLQITQPRLSCLRQGHADRFGLVWLILTAERIGARVTVQVD